MFAQIIEFTNRETTTDHTEVDVFLYGLMHNGQILSEFQLVKNGVDYKAYVTTPKIDSLDAAHDGIYVKKYRQELEKHYDIAATQIGTNAHSQEYCSCTHRTAMEMQTYHTDIDSVFTCCTCGKPIALYELPYLDNQDDHYWIFNWQGMFGATHKLWLDSLSDRFTGNQLTNVNSALNKQGMEIAREIGRQTGCKVYYNVFGFNKKVIFVKVNERHVRVCPGCGKPMQYVKLGDTHEISVCEDCLLSSDVPDEEDVPCEE